MTTTERTEDKKVSPGLYVLTQRVHNPQPDKRHKYDWRLLPSYPEGAVFEVSAKKIELPLPTPKGKREFEFLYMKPHKTLGKRFARSTYQDMSPENNPELWALILEACEPRAPTKKRETVKSLQEKAQRVADYFVARGPLPGIIAAQIVQEVLIEGKELPEGD